MNSTKEIDRKQHWEKVYETKNPDQVSWTQEKPITSLDFLDSFMLDKDAKIIDVGGGDSKLVDYLLLEGYSDITILDISAKALEKAKARLRDKSKKIKWITVILSILNLQKRMMFGTIERLFIFLHQHKSAINIYNL